MTWLGLLDEHPWLLYSLALLIGLIVGSFLNVVILRLPRMMQQAWERDCSELLATAATSQPTDTEPLSLASPPSTCPHCGHRIRAIENIPILSYLLQRGRCAQCTQRISPRYPLVELATAVLSLLVVVRFGVSVEVLPALGLTWALITLAVIDFDTQLLPDSITLPVLWLGLGLSLIPVFADSHSAIIGAIVGYLSLWTIFHLFRLATGKDGMGYGDFKLLALLGAWLGWQALPLIILLSALVGALLGVTLILSGRHERGTPIPFGPYLAAAGWLSLVWGDQLNQFYLQSVGLAP
ncbi:prepilin peptidase [Thiocapsa imhoffii]|uniref:Prepilin leader peptidase/N-methyltransferase n=1 Tax=Thiocapsa imhoffii TaxID=382777 RepID=A0A9X0WHL6_9GAMM|nr:A24 family peptidase [Thiocapsa imhoffii]MBK1644698.1 prepilin peptidase [Thiocapsa imhoffii]